MASGHWKNCRFLPWEKSLTCIKLLPKLGLVCALSTTNNNKHGDCRRKSSKHVRQNSHARHPSTSNRVASPHMAIICVYSVYIYIFIYMYKYWILMVLSWFNLAISYHPTYKWISPTLLHVHSKLPMASGTHHRAGLGTIRTRLSMNQYISVYGWHNIWCNNVQHLVEQICGWNSLKFQPWTLLAVPKKAEQRPNFIPAWLKLDEKDNKLSRRVVFSFANSCISWPYIP